MTADLNALGPPPCYCPMTAVEPELIFKPDIVPLPHPETPHYAEALAAVDAENQYRQRRWERECEADRQRVKAEEASRREMRRNCPACREWWS
ncbi:hypothetical protein EV383_4410 [Pseudonocardia sediminis]|uniref:Uncharacterized protein n=1 Tax=Pseudonocardia sediminis TaxID=1397368 RepID=A0A4Q7V083_PSEST|nr:hypothetical protein [Pseudonocardia sediminis]RZT87485.1 hypothetical protein EV383_4410 [Pseudonocardia sediminis]